MYKVLTSFWSKPVTSNHNNSVKSQSSTDTIADEDDWVLVGKIHTTNDNDNHNNSSLMTNSWIASPPLIRNDQSLSINRSSSPNTHHFNPIENLLIEHASMSVYEQIASRTRSKRQKKTVNDNKLDEQVEDGDNDNNDDDDDDGQSSVVLQYTSQHPNMTSIHHQNLNVSITQSMSSSISTLESSTSSLFAHHRHLNRIHQRRRRSTKSSSKFLLSTNNDKANQPYNKIIERQRLNYARTPKLVLHQPSRSNH